MKKRELTLLIIIVCIGSGLLIFSDQIKELLRIFLLSLMPRQELYVDLGNRYLYLNEYAELDYSGYPGDGIFYTSTPYIFPKIEEYKFDDNYITVKQIYSKQNSSELLREILYESIYNEGGWGKINTNIFPVYDSTLYYAFEKYYEIEKVHSRVGAFCDSVVANNPYFKEMEKNDYNYYIIEKNDVVKHGPLSRKEFEEEFVFLSLPSNLWIDE